MCTVYIYYAFINTHTHTHMHACMYRLKKMFSFIYKIFIHNINYIQVILNNVFLNIRVDIYIYIYIYIFIYTHTHSI